MIIGSTVVEKKIENHSDRSTNQSTTAGRDGMSAGRDAINDHSQNTVNNVYNIELKPFGDKDLSHLTPEVMQQILSHGQMALGELFRAIYFNPEKLEKGNLCQMGPANPRVRVHSKGDFWKSLLKSTVSERMVCTLVPKIRSESQKMRENTRGRFGVSQLIDRFDAFEHEPLGERLTEVMEESRMLGERSYERWCRTHRPRDGRKFQRFTDLDE